MLCRFASVTKAYHFCLAGLLAARCCKKIKKLKYLDFSRDPEGKLGTFWGSFCYVLGTKSGGVLLFRKRHKGISSLLGGLVGCKMLQKDRKPEMSRF